MPLRTIASFAVAIVLGLIAVVLVKGYLNSQHPAATQVASGTQVVVAAVPIARGATLQPNMLKTVTYPADAVPAHAFTTPAQLLGSVNGAGASNPQGAGQPSTTPTSHLALRAIAINEPILADQISGSGAKTGLSGTLTPGMRAVSLRSNDVTGVAGFALPGDRVDVLLTRVIGNGDNVVTVTQVLAQNVRILGVDQSDNVEADKPVVSKAVTVEVTPEQAQSIQLGQSVGSVALSLRQLSDTAPLARPAMTSRDLGVFGARTRSGEALAGGEKAMARKPKINPHMTEVRITRGVEMTGYPVAID